MGAIFEIEGSALPEKTKGTAFEEIEIGRIVPNPKQPRTRFNEQALDELAEGFQQGENGQRMRELLQVCGALTGELRASNAALKKDVGALLGKFEKQTEVLMRSVAEELTALRRSINEMARVTK